MAPMPDKNTDKNPDSESVIKDLMDRIAGQGEESKGQSSFPVTIVLVGILVIFISILGIKLAWAKRKAAELAIQVRRAEEEKKRAKENVRLGDNATARQAASEEAKAREKEILSLKARLAKRQSDKDVMAEELKAVTDWDDIKVVDGRGTP